ncbi:hypothetical protein FHS96_004953 [Sphingomonas zeicaulis]|uniref:hypothetical protein n=1 Tax=Sphingomonas zeicaulis TaxID=1632740 RepID=UPI003D20939C
MIGFDFPMMSAPIAHPIEADHIIRLSRRPPWSIDRADILREIETELAHRHATYPKMVSKGALDPKEAHRLIERLTDIGEGIRGHATQLPWRQKVNELRRDIFMRRRNWPQRIANHRLIEDEAADRMAAIEAAHLFYWIDGVDIDEEANGAETLTFASPEDPHPRAFDHLRAARAHEDAARAAGEIWARPIVTIDGLPMLAGPDHWISQEAA